MHLLNPAWCADCNGMAEQEKIDKALEKARILTLEGYFPANYPGRCRNCRVPFKSGDPIKRALTPGGYTGPCCAPAGDPS